MNISYIIISHNIEFLKTTTTGTFTLRDGQIFSDDRVYVHIHDHAHVHGNMPHDH
jgi:cobalt/nickel transport system ATP-binding protein